MATLRVLLIVGAVGGLTAWAVAQGSSVPAGASSVRTEASPEPAEGTGVTTAAEPGFDVEISRLRAGLAVMPSPSAPGRNPFRFGADPSVRHLPSAAQQRAVLVGTDGTDPAPVALDRPAMQLLGVAAEEGGEIAVRTAVIATPRQLYLVREGEQIALRFQVLRIGSDVVELRDLATDHTFQLALR